MWLPTARQQPDRPPNNDRKKGFNEESLPQIAGSSSSIVLFIFFT